LFKLPVAEAGAFCTVFAELFAPSVVFPLLSLTNGVLNWLKNMA
jgi:hypothetical protein